MRSLSLILILFIAISAANNEKLIDSKTKELTLLKTYVSSARDSLQADMAARWKERQLTVEQRDDDKNELEKQREALERSYATLARLQEEILTRTKMVEEEQEALTNAEEEWKIVTGVMEETFKKEADLIIEAFPTEKEKRRETLESARNRFASDKNPTSALVNWSRYASAIAENGMKVDMTRHTILPDAGTPVDLWVARFGHVFGYGMAADGSSAVYMIYQSGRLGAERYAIQPVGDGEIKNWLLTVMPQWQTSGKPFDKVKMDIMQNEQSRHLIAGRKVSYWEESFESLKAGGAIMIPLLLLPIWVVVLVLYKGIQIFGRKRLYANQYKTCIAFLDKNNLRDAETHFANSKGLMAEIIREIITRKAEKRESIEKAARERIFHEIPVLNRNLNTVAVIAGAAPLVGLLGTISGMITLFAAVTQHGTGDPKFLAGGISEALITAKTGLAVAIPALFFHDFLRNAKERLLADIEWQTSDIIDKVTKYS